MSDPHLGPPGRPASRLGSHAARRALWLALLLALPGGAQDQSSGSQQAMTGQLSRHMADSTFQFGYTDPVEEERRLRLLNVERQKSLVSDAGKLLKLAGELNAEVAQTNPDSLTQAELRKLAEIEKLAHSVKQKMSDSVGGEPVFREPPFSGPVAPGYPRF
jgi:hypothetical protein